MIEKTGIIGGLDLPEKAEHTRRIDVKSLQYTTLDFMLIIVNPKLQGLSQTRLYRFDGNQPRCPMGP